MKQLAAITAAVLVLAGAMAAYGSDSESATAYQKIMTEIQSKARSVPTYEFVDTAERLLLGFLEKYPGTPEAAGADLNLGRIYSSIGKNKEAIEHLQRYLDADTEHDQKEEAAGRFALANSYLAMENFDSAEKVYRGLLEAGAGGNERLRQMVSRQVSRIGTLRKLKTGNPAIPFKAKTAGGKAITLDDYKGKVVLLDFWASWCAPCRNEMPNVKAAYSTYNDKGFEIIGISMDDSKAKFQSYMDSQELPWPQVFDGKGWMSEIGQLYAVSSIPATFLIDRQGRIRYKNVRGEKLVQSIGELIGEK